MITESEYAKAVAEFMSRKGVTRCPTVCVVPTNASVGEDDRTALRNHAAAREAARQAKLRNSRQILIP